MPRHLAARRAPVFEHRPDRGRRRLRRPDDAHRRRVAPLPGGVLGPVADGVEETTWDEARLLDPDFDAPDGDALEGFRGLARHVDEWDAY